MTLVKQSQEIVNPEQPRQEIVNLEQPRQEIVNLEQPRQETVNLEQPRQQPVNADKPLSKLLSKVILLGAGVGLLAWGLSLTATRVTAVAAIKAFVNGEIITINSPTPGQVQTKLALNSGMPVTSQQALLKVIDTVSDADRLHNMQFELAAEKAKLELIEGKIKEVSQSDNTDRGRVQQVVNEKASDTENLTSQNSAEQHLNIEAERNQVDAVILRAQQNLAQTEIELAIAQNHARIAQSKYEKVYRLAKEGAMPTFAVDETFNNVQVSQDQVKAAKLKIETAKLDLAEQQKLGTIKRLQLAQSLRQPQSLPKVTPQSTKIDLQIPQLNPILSDLERQKNDLQVSIQLKEKALDQTTKYSTVMKGYQAIASTTGVLWEAAVQNGDQVNAGQPLVKILNCQQVWVDAYVNIDDLKRMGIGSPAQVELQDNHLKLNGKVKTIRSSLSGSQKLGQDVAVNPPDINNDQHLAQVRIELENQPQLISSKDNSAEFCHVGQIAKVNIEQKNSFLSNLMQLGTSLSAIKSLFVQK